MTVSSDLTDPVILEDGRIKIEGHSAGLLAFDGDKIADANNLMMLVLHSASGCPSSPASRSLVFLDGLRPAARNTL